MFTIIMFQKSACAGIIKKTVDYVSKSDAAMVCYGDFRLYVLGQIIYSVIGKDRAKMKTILLHGLGQTAQDWKEVVCQLSSSNVECPELFSSMDNEISYSRILGDLERRYSNAKEPLRICGLSLGALLAIDFAIRYGDKVASLVLIGTQYKVPSLLIDFQNLIFCCMPNKAFESMGLSKSNTIKLAHSMRSLDFTAQLSGIHCPVNILCGEKDSANLKASKKLSEILPKATLQIVPGAGHEINKDAPEAIAAILNK